jgi:hypothetical protein
METFVVWGWLLTAQMPGMPPIIDLNYETEATCEAVKAEFLLNYPTYDVACTPTWKPDSAPKAKKRVVHKKPVHKKPAARKPTYQRTARR